MTFLHICLLYIIWLTENNFYSYGKEILLNDEIFTLNISQIIENLNSSIALFTSRNKNLSKYNEEISLQPTSTKTKIIEVFTKIVFSNFDDKQYNSVYTSDKHSRSYSSIKLRSSIVENIDMADEELHMSAKNSVKTLNLHNNNNNNNNSNVAMTTNLYYNSIGSVESHIARTSLQFHNGSDGLHESELDNLFINVFLNHSYMDHKFISDIKTTSTLSTDIVNLKTDYFSVSADHLENQITYSEVYLIPSFMPSKEETLTTLHRSTNSTQIEYSVISSVLPSKYPIKENPRIWIKSNKTENNTIDICNIYVKPFSYEFSIIFNCTEECELQFLKYLRQYFDDKNCEIHKTAFIKGFPAIFSWTNISVNNNNRCNLTEIDLEWFKMVERNESLKTEFVEKFLPNIQIIKAHKRYIGVCLEVKNSNLLHMIIITVFTVLMLLFVIIGLIFKKKVLIFKIRFKDRFNNLDMLGCRPPIILPMEKQ
ncbi:probable polyketide synthase 42 [Centruroides sculpturatus]|uniref:probable polyketide synthase 42 n=1 Tax=Centruroides sculpturatus TaxID=218467 RepID=UPI000C6D87DA|nr:probable polyketide synthase 42 [Centruroides sculpturatus]XP_023233897.1 probable polyketide synthase 42 [Centruroides sculpturatus]